MPRLDRVDLPVSRGYDALAPNPTTRAVGYILCIGARDRHGTSAHGVNHNERDNCGRPACTSNAAPSIHQNPTSASSATAPVTNSTAAEKATNITSP
jgi:hypothetical protein